MGPGVLRDSRVGLWGKLRRTPEGSGPHLRGSGLHPPRREGFDLSRRPLLFTPLEARVERGPGVFPLPPGPSLTGDPSFGRTVGSRRTQSPRSPLGKSGGRRTRGLLRGRGTKWALFVPYRQGPQGHSGTFLHLPVLLRSSVSFSRRKGLWECRRRAPTFLRSDVSTSGVCKDGPPLTPEGSRGGGSLGGLTPARRLGVPPGSDPPQTRDEGRRRVYLRFRVLGPGRVRTVPRDP